MMTNGVFIILFTALVSHAARKQEIQNEKEKSALLGRQLEEKLSYEIMKRNAAENVEVINLTRQVDDMAKQIQRQQDEQRRALEAELTKQGGCGWMIEDFRFMIYSNLKFYVADLEVHIRREKDKNSALFEECERLKKNIERIKENMSEVEVSWGKRNLYFVDIHQR